MIIKLSSLKIFLGKFKEKIIHYSRFLQIKDISFHSKLACLMLILAFYLHQPVISPALFISPVPRARSMRTNSKQKEIFGFGPYWVFNDKMDSVDFSALTTFAYFDVPVLPDGELDRESPGFTTFKSDKATEIFNKAHQKGTRVVLTLTQMNNGTIEQFLDDNNAQDNAIIQAISEVKKRDIDGVNVDFEYMGDPGDDYRSKFTEFIKKFAFALHHDIHDSKITVSVYASSIKDPKIYDIGQLSKVSDGIFMMAYDFATSDASNVMPTAPLYGYKQGQYWYDVSTAVEDFLKHMPGDKLILGLPWYGYNYSVSEPKTNAETNQGYYASYWYGRKKYSYYVPNVGVAQQYSEAKDSIQPELSGWDPVAQVGWQAYHSPEDGSWRMIFMEDPKSLSIKYDFAISKNLGGIGIWALGFDGGKKELWDILKEKFPIKLVNSLVKQKKIYETS